jgi:monoterpene epsilon-lactone hydrolase
MDERVRDDGTIHIDGFDLPGSVGWSDEARSVFVTRLRSAPVSASTLRVPANEEEWLETARSFRQAMEGLHRRLLRRIAEDHPCTVVDDVIGGVPVRWVSPARGIDPSKSGRLLVNLHGGAFMGGAEHCGLVESLPVASVGGYRVCVVDYRQGWEHRFPAASEDVATVLGGLSEHYETGNVGVFGYSAGGALTAQAAAWCAAHGLAMPGALAICSAGAGGGGDATILGALAMGGAAPSAQVDDDSNTALGANTAPARFGYAAGIAPTDPLLAPLHAPELLAQFPPTMVLTGSRSFDQSGALRTHRALLAAGVATELHCWEGMWHCFPYNHRMPEAIDAFSTIVGFFDRHLSGGRT